MPSLFLPAVLLDGLVVHLLVDGHVDLLVHGHVLDDGDGHVLNDWHFLVDGHLLHVVMMYGVHVVGDVDHVVLTGIEQYILGKGIKDI